jgi:hypothetical protein
MDEPFLRITCSCEGDVPMNAIELSTSNVDVPSSEAIRYPDERQRAGYLSLGFMLGAASLVGLQVPLMPSTLFAFCALLCLIQLSSRALHWFETNGVARHALSLWRRLVFSGWRFSPWWPCFVWSHWRSVHAPSGILK